MNLERSVRGALAGALASGVWAIQQPLDKRVFGSSYDDVELLGKAITRGPEWPLAGTALHIQNGAAFGALYAQLKPFIPGPPIARGAAAGLAEHVALWPLVRLVDRFHPARDELEPLDGSWRAFAQATWRHLLFGIVLGAVEDRLNADQDIDVPPIPASSNGHGSIEAAVGAA